MIEFNNLCQYKNIFGEPNKGVHTHYFGFALFDLFVTIIVAFILMLYFKKYTNISHSLTFGIILLILLLIAEYLHKIFCITQ
jgi:hypothetical protein